jgi:hypothetical protein
MHRAIIFNPNDVKPGADLTSFVQWSLETLHGLKLFGLTPVVVFDGASPPSKNTTNDSEGEEGSAVGQVPSISGKWPAQHERARSVLQHPWGSSEATHGRHGGCQVRIHSGSVRSGPTTHPVLDGQQELGHCHH